MREIPYNPLDKINLARSVEQELLSRTPIALAQTDQISGAGIYVIYYTGDFPAYAVLKKANSAKTFEMPIYIGKAIPKGGRKGGLSSSASSAGRALADRLRAHAVSIQQTENLQISDFYVRHLIVDDIWIPLGENILIEKFKPVWNIAIDGFGNKDPGNRRKTQFMSPWDVLHPGRSFAQKLAKSPATLDLLFQRIEDHFAGRPLTKLPKEVLKQQEDIREEAEERADDV